VRREGRALSLKEVDRSKHLTRCDNEGVAALGCKNRRQKSEKGGPGFQEPVLEVGSYIEKRKGRISGLPGQRGGEIGGQEKKPLRKGSKNSINKSGAKEMANGN